MRIVVTGASGNVGTALLRRLAAESDTEVVGVSRRAPQQNPPYAGVRWSEVDIGVAGAEQPLQDVMRGADAVVHLAWLIQPSHDERTMFRTNVSGSDRVFAAAARVGVPHVVHMSSIGAYSPSDKERLVDEQWPTDGVSSSYYSRHKAAVEHLLDLFVERNPDVVVSRPRPGLILQSGAAAEIARYFLGRLVPAPLFRLAARGKVPLLPLPARTCLQFVHADDVADALVRVLRTRLPGAVNLVSEPVITPRVLASLVGARHVSVPEPVLRGAAAVSWKLRLQPTSAGWVDLALASPLLSAERARTELGWVPQHDARDALRELLAALGHRRGVTGSPPLAPGR
ncbi:NAD-dependent epimerase/dehydratase family protein [Umezawaea beigongshangensis]|uniref:NAD-dependent epimerase/dehydratase family protein n=1 Tax=Umezawaea beigongshangensis TaxID=2780383 RepID=UPI0018F10EDE|nr:NAD-dependent epimerase/dehydratase family protein [Umezawaea beigongshangensis]